MTTQPIGVTFSEELKRQMWSDEAISHPIDFDDAWVWMQYSRKDPAVRAMIAELDADFDYVLHKSVEHGVPGSFGDSSATKPTKYYLTVDGFKLFCMAAGTARGKEVRRYFLAMEKDYKALAADKAIKDVFPPTPRVLTNHTDRLDYSALETEAEQREAMLMLKIGKYNRLFANDLPYRDALVAEAKREIMALRTGSTGGTTSVPTNRQPKKTPHRYYLTQVEHFESVVGDREVINLNHIMRTLMDAGMPCDKSIEAFAAFARKQGWRGLADNKSLWGAQLTFKSIATKSGALTKLRFYSKTGMPASPIDQYLPAVVKAHQFVRQGVHLVDSQVLASALNTMYGYFPMVVTQRYVTNRLAEWGWERPEKGMGKDYPRLRIVPLDLQVQTAPEVALYCRSRQGGRTGQLDLLSYIGTADFVCSARLHYDVTTAPDGDADVSLRGIAEGLKQLGFKRLEPEQTNRTCVYGNQTSFAFYARTAELAATLGKDDRGWDFMLREVIAGCVTADGTFQARSVVHAWNQRSDRAFDAQVRWMTDSLPRLGFVLVKKLRTGGGIWRAAEGGNENA